MMGPKTVHRIPKTTNIKQMSSIGPKQSIRMSGLSSFGASSAWAMTTPENSNTDSSNDTVRALTLASIDLIGSPDYSTVTAVPYANSSDAPAVTALVANRTFTIAFAPLAAASETMRAIASLLDSSNSSV